jgi:hypothetical protein
VPYVGLFVVLVGLVTAVARHEIAGAYLTRDDRRPSDRQQWAHAYLWLIVGTATAIAGILLFTLNI